MTKNEGFAEVNSNLETPTNDNNTEKPLILNKKKSNKVDISNILPKDKKILYVSGEIVSYPLDKELLSKGYNVNRLVNYSAIHNENLDLSFLNLLSANCNSVP